MINRNHGIFLDFDGVLFDTVKEAYCVASISTEAYQNVDEISFDSEHYTLFRRFRYLVTSAWTYYYLLKVIDGAFDENSHEERFRYFMDHQDVAQHKKFERQFFRTRKVLKETDEKSWLVLNLPYPFFTTVKRLIYNGPDRFYIITTKDKETVLKLMDHYGLCFNKENIMDRYHYNRYLSKRNIIESIVHQKKIEQSIFIDDSRKHLTDCENISGLTLFQPEWGYVKPGDSTVSEAKITLEIRKLLGG